MRRLRIATLSVVTALLVAGPASAAPPPVPDEYVVVLRPGVADSAAEAGRFARQNGLEVRHTYTRALDGLSARIPPARLASVAADPRVELVVHDELLQWDGDVTATGVSRIEADTPVLLSHGIDVDVAILDTGIDPTHPDLNVSGGHSCVSGRKASWADDVGHGTMVAGIVGGRSVGVAPGVRLWAVKVGTAKGAKTSDLICGLEWLAEQGGRIEVANLSLSGPSSGASVCGQKKKDALHHAICGASSAGVTIVVSAGNNATDLAAAVPASYPEVLAATAIVDYDGQPAGLAAPTCRPGTDDTAAEFSNFALAAADAAHTIAAPGACIVSTALGGGYATMSGTSAASPHVAGTAARCIARGPCAGLDPAQVIQRLRADAAGQPESYGFAGDPHRPLAGAPTRYYGHLIHAGDY